MALSVARKSDAGNAMLEARNTICSHFLIYNALLRKLLHL